LSSATGDLTAILARAAEKSREALDVAHDEAQAWLEELRSGALSADSVCAVCGRSGELEDNHVAGRRHGDLTVPMCRPCHRRFTEGQDLWPHEWRRMKRTPDLDLALLLLGVHDLLQLKARDVPEAASGAYLALAASVREQYARVAGRLP